ncbi:hypothetical protein mvi_60540 (plasmid) [Methylobacterium indicum]|uniref:Uncharacterized protein n=1 Tax=Methylobacterium indicum TaxID=1775910 RepID=A0A8H8WZY2_9HYPH|nr:hypothetical protein mvi_60540 [Methylobacterium indicum]
MQKILLSVSMVIISTICAKAQSEYETATYVLIGEHNRSTASNDYLSPARDNGDRWRMAKRVERIDSCKYQLITDWTTLHPNGTESFVKNIERFDLNALSSADLDPTTIGQQRIELRGHEFACWTSIRGDKATDFGCRNKSLISIAGDTQVWIRAYAHLRANFCKGRAF